MEEAEVPLEQSQEHIQHHAEHHEEGKRWVLGVALSSAIFAALAAVASLQSGYRVDEALISQLRASDSWALYQAKGIKSGVLKSEIEVLAALGHSAPPGDKSVEKYAAEQKDIQNEANKLEKERTEHLEHHEKLATAVTMFQICIAISAISVLTQRRTFWFVSLLAGAAGVFYMVSGLFIH